MKLEEVQGSFAKISNLLFEFELPYFKTAKMTYLKLLLLLLSSSSSSSSETQGQIVGARESLNGRKNMARRKVKNGEKSPLGQCLTRPVPNGLIGARKLLCFSAQSEARTTATVWNWSGKTLSPGALLAVLYFSSCHIFPPV